MIPWPEKDRATVRSDLAAMTWMIAARPHTGDSVTISEGFDWNDPWSIAGIAALFTIALCLLWQWIGSARQGRFVVPVSACFAGLIATLVLLVYAMLRGEPLFIGAEALSVFVAFRLFILARQIRRRQDSAAQLSFPRVSPETAERKYTDTDSRTGFSTRPS
jgi:lipid-A-disaccharide synthase-like uncharacterized protein